MTCLSLRFMLFLLKHNIYNLFYNLPYNLFYKKSPFIRPRKKIKFLLQNLHDRS